MRQRRPRRVALLSVITAGMIGSILIPWAAQRATAASGGGTSASANGDTVTIAVNIDICCGGTRRDPANFDSLVRDDVMQAEAVWNQALSRLPYKGCFSIRVAFSVHILTGTAAEDGYHYLYVDPTEPGRSYVQGPPVGDSTWVYLNDVGQSSLFLASMSIVTWEHEIGHLMGLQDDYQDQVVGGATVSVALPGRAGTLMDSGSSIDQNLADRLGDLAAKSGLKLPGCWAGTMNESLVVGPCTSSVHATMGIVVKADGAVAGTWTGSETAPGCRSHAPFYLGSFPISGNLVDRKFLFPSLPSMPDYPPPISIPLVSSTSAVAHLVWSAPGGSQTSDFSLTCMGC
jgi:hypothetical protein